MPQIAPPTQLQKDFFQYLSIWKTFLFSQGLLKLPRQTGGRMTLHYEAKRANYLYGNRFRFPKSLRVMACISI
jgi:hypothetical protein